MDRFVTGIGRRVLLRDSRGSVLFDPTSMQIFKVNLPSHLSLKEISLQLADALPTPDTESLEKDTITAPSILNRQEAMLPLLIDDKTLMRSAVKPAINKLSVNIANTCNLKCTYCYAGHGAYNSTRFIMSPSTSTTIVSRVLEHWSTVRKFHFFGGEPFLNVDAINAIGYAFKNARDKDSLHQMPQFIATTNGTISSDEIIESIKRWAIDIMVSWDGPAEVQDICRPLAKRNGSSSELVQNSIKRFDNYGIDYRIECTYSSRHFDLGISIVDLMDYFYRKTGKSVVHVSPASVSSMPHYYSEGTRGKKGQAGGLEPHTDRVIERESLIPIFREAAGYSLKNLFRGHGPTLSMVNSIASKIATQERSKSYCGAFNNQFAIGADGSIYPCFIFAGDPSFRLGNILSDKFPSKESASVFRRYLSEFGTNLTGTTEWYEPLFSGCIASDYMMTGKLNERWWAPIYEAIIEECIIEVANREDVNEESTIPAIAGTCSNKEMRQ